jgi:hypothetical protein
MALIARRSSFKALLGIDMLRLPNLVPVVIQTATWVSTTIT